ncbi:glycosyltransferase family 2 protein [Salinibacterium hongtaonis]|uniref:Glycosyltransferase family 2 protein n=1 Tax=Homoserinimonas hongtaonis TaxID=2079791 RepID=A0A2U1T378_9MICO|nr:glycosyltransferase family A protein [Salinibacterium hongtaonis]AWB90566.1 glycosyltransferase family 2 protein [Salinibacterium hongtaonis]PWB98344.1 glycosyltransferase family 2 protein [Salinibacterium hongtaonis]
MVFISVVIPSLNDARMLERCLAALAQQTRAPDEVIVVDNGSTDDTAEVGRAAGATVVTEPRRGVLRATAAGFDAAKGDILGRLDADSRPAPDWVARVEERFTADPTLFGLTGPGDFYDCGPVWQFIGKNIYIGGYYWLMSLFLGQVPLFGSNMAIRRETWLDVRTRIHRDNPRVHDDMDISFALDPAMAVELDDRLTAYISARPFDTLGGFLRKADWACRSMVIYLSEVSWLDRRRLRAEARRRRADERFRTA